MKTKRIYKRRQRRNNTKYKKKGGFGFRSFFGFGSDKVVPLEEPLLQKEKTLQEVGLRETIRTGKDDESMWKKNFVPVSSNNYVDSRQNISDKTDIQKIRTEELGIDKLVEKDITNLTKQKDDELCNEYDELLQISPSNEYKSSFLNGIKNLEKIKFPFIKQKIDKLNQCPSRKKKSWFYGGKRIKTRKNNRKRKTKMH